MGGSTLTTTDSGVFRGLYHLLTAHPGERLGRRGFASELNRLYAALPGSRGSRALGA